MSIVNQLIPLKSFLNDILCCINNTIIYITAWSYDFQSIPRNFTLIFSAKIGLNILSPPFTSWSQCIQMNNLLIRNEKPLIDIFFRRVFLTLTNRSNILINNNLLIKFSWERYFFKCNILRYFSLFLDVLSFLCL